MIWFMEPPVFNADWCIDSDGSEASVNQGINVIGNSNWKVIEVESWKKEKCLVFSFLSELLLLIGLGGICWLVGSSFSCIKIEQ